MMTQSGGRDSAGVVTRAGSRTVRALLAEDHPRYRARVQDLLLAWGCEVMVAEDGREALRLLRAHHDIDVVVTDMEMPHFTGFEVIEAWLRAGRSRETIVMVTGEADALWVQERCHQLGVRLLHKLHIETRLEAAVLKMAAFQQ